MGTAGRSASRRWLPSESSEGSHSGFYNELAVLNSEQSFLRPHQRVWPVLARFFEMPVVVLLSESGPAVFMSGSRGGVAKNEATTAVFHLPSLVCFLKSAFFPKGVFPLERVPERASDGDLPHGTSVARARGSDYLQRCAIGAYMKQDSRLS